MHSASEKADRNHEKPDHVYRAQSGQPDWSGANWCVTFSKTGKTLYYRGRKFQCLKGGGFKSNFYDLASGDDYWISGCRKDGVDRLYGERVAIYIDEDVRDEYWTMIRQLPSRKDEYCA